MKKWINLDILLLTSWGQDRSGKGVNSEVEIVFDSVDCRFFFFFAARFSSAPTKMGPFVALKKLEWINHRTHSGWNRSSRKSIYCEIWNIHASLNFCTNSTPPTTCALSWNTPRAVRYPNFCSRNKWRNHTSINMWVVVLPSAISKHRRIFTHISLYILPPGSNSAVHWCFARTWISAHENCGPQRH